MSLFYDENAPETLEDISNTLSDYVDVLAYEIHSVEVDARDFLRQPDKEISDSLNRRLIDMGGKADDLKYLSDKLQEISRAFTVINRTVFNPSGGWVRK